MIGEQRGMGEGRIKTDLDRGRKRLKEEVEKEDEKKWRKRK